ncbi:twin-arginine translocase TatA/TatE family subunit [Formicincola oecophyllae]|uniref:Sec-independent protein translocase protein TatA n=1 Tax=Formicincola oecophyllae TaxID=2558361 RepID=A0A4Y6U7P2_9PROT|nr:twin-arginine translocase TatA/TatE family subunit [Formicincola oecophyllae]QDH13429.1 twin-arginine translocase TatA/TatE family subunit [Formicincola oecophyllae]
MGSLSPSHLIILAVIVLVLFGTGKISGFMGEFAKGIKSFKKTMAEVEEPTTQAGQGNQVPPVGPVSTQVPPAQLHPGQTAENRPQEVDARMSDPTHPPAA